MKETEYEWTKNHECEIKQKSVSEKNTSEKRTKRFDLSIESARLRFPSFYCLYIVRAFTSTDLRFSADLINFAHVRRDLRRREAFSDRVTKKKEKWLHPRFGTMMQLTDSNSDRVEFLSFLSRVSLVARFFSFSQTIVPPARFDSF